MKNILSVACVLALAVGPASAQLGRVEIVPEAGISAAGPAALAPGGTGLGASVPPANALAAAPALCAPIFVADAIKPSGDRARELMRKTSAALGRAASAGAVPEGEPRGVENAAGERLSPSNGGHAAATSAQVPAPRARTGGVRETVLVIAAFLALAAAVVCAATFAADRITDGIIHLEQSLRDSTHEPTDGSSTPNAFPD
jgi:hypothetical protein